jgi:tripartite-type tricarboxylate transporter receptor subunit TctC
VQEPAVQRRAIVQLGLLAAALGPGLAGLPAQAQSFPERPPRLVVGFPPGTGPDVLTRTLGNKLGELWKQAPEIDNRAGAGGQIGAAAVAKSAPDGYTLLVGEVGSIAIAPAAYSKLPYDPAKELLPLAEVGRSDFVLVVPAGHPARDLKTFIETGRAAAAKGEKLNFATFGAGTPGHFGAETLADAAKFKVEPIHYRATGDAVTALVAGDVQAAFVSTALATPQVKAGKVRALATTAPQRAPQLPEVPTFAESGWPGINFSAWFVVFAPAGTPPALADAISRQVLAAAQSAEVKAKLQEAGFSVSGGGREATERMVREEAARWAGVVKATGFKGD